MRANGEGVGEKLKSRLLKGPVLVGMEACGSTLWFERLLASLDIELRLGDAGKSRALEVRKQKTDRRDAQLLLQLLLENRFPEVWVPSVQQRDTRQLLLHRQKLVAMRRQVNNNSSSSYARKRLNSDST